METTGGSGTSATQYDVFLSFRGPDTRDTFTDCLYRTMVGQGIVAYIDSEELHTGDRINDLLTAVGDSKICIPVLSKGYASSAWCLRELARMMELNESTRKPAILPIFFDVTPSDVKHGTKVYKEDLEKHERRHGAEMRRRWESALGKVADITGREVQGKAHGEVIELVVKEVLRKLKVKQRPMDSKLVGVDGQVEDIMKLLDVDSGTSVRFVGIHGMGGIGKTTLAKIVYNELCLLFDGQCSFIENIQGSSNKNGLKALYKKLVSDICGSRFAKTSMDTDEWIGTIRNRVQSKKVLIVLDGLYEKKQLKKLVWGLSTVDSGSRIIITTTDKRILNEVEGISLYEVKQMDLDKALELFSLHAFKNVSPRDGFQSLSREIVLTTGGLPLALEVIGSHLCLQNEKEVFQDEKKVWKEMLEKLKNIPHVEVREKLKISYDALDIEEREIFLDIACFFVDEKKSRATYFWDACGQHPHVALKELTDLCLIKIVDGDIIWMHDQLRDLGRDIVRRESTQNLTRRSRLWNAKEAWKVVRSNEIKDKVQGLNLVEHGSRRNMSRNAKEAWKVVRSIEDKVRGLNLVEHGSRRNRLRNAKEARKVVRSNEIKDKVQGLNLVEHGSDSICIGGEELKKMPNLKFLKLKGGTFVGDINNCLLELRWLSWDYPPLDCRMTNLQSKNLVVFELSNNENSDNWVGWNILQMANQLKVLVLLSCSGLTRTPNFSGCLSLERLTLHDCSNLEEVDSSIRELKGLTHLDIIHCKNLRNLPKEIGGLRNLKNVSIIGDSKMEKLPSSIGKFTQLKFLSLCYCQNLRNLPKSISELTSLQELHLSGTKIVELPNSIENFKQLKVMSLKNSSIERLPASIGMLKRLEELDASECSQLAGELPNEIGKLSSLTILNLSSTHVRAMPTSINSLMQLQKLYLVHCNELQELPKLPPSLNCLHVESTSLRLVPNLNNLTNLVELYLSNRSGKALAQASNPGQTLQLQGVGKLFQLEILKCELSYVYVPSTELGCLPRLRDLTIPGMDNFNSMIVGPQLTNLKNLSTLRLYNSPMEEIQLDRLELLRNLSVESCEFLEKLSIISSSLRKLCKMQVYDCRKLLEIQFLGTMESLVQFSVSYCCSLERSCGLSNAKKLKYLRFYVCEGLRVVEGHEELELLESLDVGSYRSLKWLNVSNSKIPNKCLIVGRRVLRHIQLISFANYRKKILGKTRKNQRENEMEKDSEDITEENNSIDCSDSKDSTKENDRIDCSDSEDSTKENDRIDCSDSKDSTKEKDCIDCSDSKDSRKEKDRIDCSDSKDSRKEKDRIDCSDSKDSTKENDRIDCLDSEDSTKENDHIDCSDSEASTKENDCIDCSDLEASTKEKDSIDCSICILECFCEPFRFLYACIMDKGIKARSMAPRECRHSSLYT